MRPDRLWKQAYVAFGGNVGDVLQTFREVIASFHANENIEVIKYSSVYKTQALVAEGNADNVAPYWNAVCALRTGLGARKLMENLQALEHEAGRTRSRPWASRTLDLDLLAYDRQVVVDKVLSLPHPRLSERNFVLQPFAEIAAEYKVPKWEKSVAQLLAMRLDQCEGIIEKRENWLTL